jgi:hypothetical protein
MHCVLQSVVRMLCGSEHVTCMCHYRSSWAHCMHRWRCIRTTRALLAAVPLNMHAAMQ